MALAIVDHFQQPGNRHIVQRLRESGVAMEMEQAPSAQGPQPLAGKRLVVTGRLQRFTRSQIEGLIKELGGRVSGSVGKNTDYLVAGEDPGSKLGDAQQLGVPIMSEDEFLALTQGRP